MINIITIILVISIIIWFFTKNNKENFTLGPNLHHEAKLGKFKDDYLIGVTPVKNLDQCKKVCNKMESCEGISYTDKPGPIECRLYNDTAWMIPYTNYLSWRKFGTKIY